MFKLMLLLTIVPLMELYLLVKLTQWWDSFALTVFIIIGTGIAGAWLARREGLRTLRRVQQRLARAELPGDDLLDGLLILIAGALLVTPGVMTDVAGFVLLAPPTRALVRRGIKRRLRHDLAAGRIIFHSSGGFRPVDTDPPAGSPPLEDEDNL